LHLNKYRNVMRKRIKMYIKLQIFDEIRLTRVRCNKTINLRVNADHQKWLPSKWPGKLWLHIILSLKRLLL